MAFSSHLANDGISPSVSSSNSVDIGLEMPSLESKRSPGKIDGANRSDFNLGNMAHEHVRSSPLVQRIESTEGLVNSLVEMIGAVSENLQDLNEENFSVSTERLLWTIAVILFSWWSILSVPIPIVMVDYMLDSEKHIWFTVICYVADCVFILDIILRLKYPTLRFKRGVWNSVQHTSGIQGLRTYVCGSAFLIDFVSMLPLEIFGFLLTGQASWLLRANKFLRVLRLSHLLKVVARWRWEHHLESSVHVNRMCSLFLAMAVASHFAGLLFFMLSLENARTPKTREYYSYHGSTTLMTASTWAQNDGLWKVIDIELSSNHSNFTQIATAACASEHGLLPQYQAGTAIVCFLEPEHVRYWRSVYWAVITMVTIGFGDIVPATWSETVFCTVVLYVGVTITACAVANLTRMAASLDSASTEMQRRMDEVEKYLKFRGVPDKTRIHVRHYFKFGKKHDTIIREADVVFEGFPCGTKLSAIEDVPFHVLLSHTAFANLPSHLLHALAGRLKLRMYVPGQTITVRGVPCKMTMFLSHGVAAVVSDSNENARSLSVTSELDLENKSTHSN